MSDKFYRLSRKILKIIPKTRKIQPTPRVDVFLLSNLKLRALKRKFLKKDAKVVDILAFGEPKNFPYPEGGGRYLGEVYLNATIAIRDPERATFLLIHGILHLLGYLHQKKSDTMEMQRLEKNVLRKLKLEHRASWGQILS